MRFFVLSALLLLLTPADIVALSTLMALASVKDLYEQTEQKSKTSVLCPFSIDV